MEEKLNFLEPLFEKAEDYAKTSFELFKLKTIDRTVGIFSTVVLKVIAFSVFSMFLLIGSIGASFWLGELLGEFYVGFFCVAGLYAVVLCIICFFMKNWIKDCVSNWIILKMNN